MSFELNLKNRLKFNKKNCLIILTELQLVGDNLFIVQWINNIFTYLLILQQFLSSEQC